MLCLVYWVSALQIILQDLEEGELEGSKAANTDIIPSSAILKQLAVAIE